MSRVGKLAIAIPDQVKVEINGLKVDISGPKGALSKHFGEGVKIIHADRQIKVDPIDDSKHARAMWGTVRSVISNMVHGVSNGFTQNLEMVGVGYRAALKGKFLNLSLAKSHNTIMEIPESIKVAVP